MILLSRLVMLAFVIVLLVFCMSNLDPVSVRMLTWESPPLPLFLVLLFLFFFGFFLALVWQALHGLTHRKETRSVPVVVQTTAPELQKDKSGRRWGLGLGKKGDPAVAVKSAEQGAAERRETVDKEGGKDNITDGPDEPAASEK